MYVSTNDEKDLKNSCKLKNFEKNVKIPTGCESSSTKNFSIEKKISINFVPRPKPSSTQVK